ncbi:catalase [Nocardia suismassiliense]|uniref:catalase n=1 Tax=Nocardia suismassiliense TaxID=2077092 RepID=UPI00131F485A|nr:catalase [Nocardia suismassiliense]
MPNDPHDDDTRFVEQLAAATGADPRQRLLHARGRAATGDFTPYRQAAQLSTAEVFAAARTPFTARFSSTLGGSEGHDGDPGDHGLAVRIGDLDLVMFTLPVFFVRNGPDMIAFLRATGSGDPAAVIEFVRHHPEAATALSLAEQALPITGFTGVTYHAVHAFGLVDAAGVTRWARLSWRPLQPLPALTVASAQALPRDYLATELATRLPAHFELTAHLPDADDDVHDPTQLWTGQESIPLGMLTLTRAETCSSETDFDPMRLPDGMIAPRDQLSKDRSTIYRAARRYRAGRVPAADKPSPVVELGISRKLAHRPHRAHSSPS